MPVNRLPSLPAYRLLPTVGNCMTAAFLIRLIRPGGRGWQAWQAWLGDGISRDSSLDGKGHCWLDLPKLVRHRRRAWQRQVEGGVEGFRIVICRSPFPLAAAGPNQQPHYALSTVTTPPPPHYSSRSNSIPDLALYCTYEEEGGITDKEAHSRQRMSRQLVAVEQPWCWTLQHHLLAQSAKVRTVWAARQPDSQTAHEEVPFKDFRMPIADDQCVCGLLLSENHKRRPCWPCVSRIHHPP